MQRSGLLRKLSYLRVLQQRGYHDNVQKRFLATVKDVFPHKTDFPSRHIGPRKTEVVAMLDLLGFKVCKKVEFPIGQHLLNFYLFFFLIVIR